jgi:hypothetical protein
MGNAQSTDNPSAVAIDKPSDFPITSISSTNTTTTAPSVKSSTSSEGSSTNNSKPRSTKSNNSGYNAMPQRTIIRATNTPKKPQPYTGSFFNNHYAEPVPHAHVKKPNRPAGHVNFFEVAAATHQPVSSTKSRSGHSNSSNSSLKTSSVKTYPSSQQQHKLKKLSSNASSTNNSQTSSTGSTAVADENNNNKKPPLPANNFKEDADYIYLDGRRYWKGHGSQIFILPCDDDENDRLMTIVSVVVSFFSYVKTLI